MNTGLLVLLCNLAIALGASVNYQPRGLAAKPSGPLALTTRQEVPSGPSGTAQALPTIGSRSINDAEFKQAPQTAETADEPSQQGDRQSFEDAEAALREHYTALKMTMTNLQNSHASLQGDRAKLELEKVFLKANGAIMLVQAHSGKISSLTGVDKKELDLFFADLSQDVSGLHQALEESDHKLDDLKMFFTELLARVSKLQIVSENPKAKSQQVTAFFKDLIEMISNLEKDLATPNRTPAEHEVDLKAFFMTLGANIANLEAEMAKQGVLSN